MGNFLPFLEVEHTGDRLHGGLVTECVPTLAQATAHVGVHSNYQCTGSARVEGNAADRGKDTACPTDYIIIFR